MIWSVRVGVFFTWRYQQSSSMAELYFFLEQHSFEKTKSIGLMAVSQMFLTMVAGNAPKTQR